MTSQFSRSKFINGERFGEEYFFLIGTDTSSRNINLYVQKGHNEIKDEEWVDWLGRCYLHGCRSIIRITPALAADGANCKVTTTTSKAECDLITVALVNKVLSLDPANAGRTTNQNYVTKLLVQGLLFRYDAKGVAQPDLVDKYTVSDDGLTYTLTLLKDLKYSDGVTPVTADDAVFSWEYNLNPAPPGFQAVTKVVAKDTQTIVITLSKPFSDFPRALAGIYYPINPRSKAAEIQVIGQIH